MSTRALRAAAVRSYKRRKTALDLDLNCAPPGENREQEDGPSQQIEPQEVQAGHQQPVLQPAMIDVEAIDDDVVESSPRAFAEAKNNSRRNRLRTIVVVDLGNGSSMRENVTRPPEPPKEPVFNCPICMCPLEEEMSTRCGHIFCKGCIKAAINAQGKCPTCRKKVIAKELIRVFLPSTS